MKHTRGTLDPSEDKQEECNVCHLFFKDVRTHKSHSKCGDQDPALVIETCESASEGSLNPLEDDQEDNLDMTDGAGDNGFDYFEDGDDIPLENGEELMGD